MLAVYIKKINKYLYNNTNFKNHIILIYNIIFFAIGIGIYFSLTFEPSLISIILLCVLLAILIINFLFNNSIIIITHVVFVLFGFVYSYCYVHSNNTQIINKNIYVDIVGTVVNIKKDRKKCKTVILHNNTISNSSDKSIVNLGKVNLYACNENIKVGSVLELRAKIMPISQPVLPNSYNFRRNKWLEGFSGRGYAISKVKVKQGAISIFEDIRSKIKSILLTVLSSGSESAIAIAVVTGSRSFLTEDILYKYRSSGIGHLIAISGLHIGLVSGFIFFFVRMILALIPAIVLRYNIKKWSAIISIISTTFYILIAEYPVSAVRAGIMLACAFTAMIANRNPFSIRAVIFAMFIILLVNPIFLFKPSFQMSFAAVVLLVIFFSHNSLPNTSVFEYIKNTAIISLIASIGTAFFTIMHFNVMPTYGILTNIIAVPIFSILVMPCLLIGLLLYNFYIGEYIIILAKYGLIFIEYIAVQINSLPFNSVIHIANFDKKIGAFMIILIIFGLLYHGIVKRISAVLFIVCLICILYYPQPFMLINQKIVGINLSDGMISNIISKRNFMKSMWSQSLGQSTLSWPKNNKIKDNNIVINCIAETCLIQNNDVKIIIFFARYPVLSDLCKNFDLAIFLNTRYPPKYCKEFNNIIDLNDIYLRGTHSIYYNNNSITIKTEPVGLRPWNM